MAHRTRWRQVLCLVVNVVLPQGKTVTVCEESEEGRMDAWTM